MKDYPICVNCKYHYGHGECIRKAKQKNSLISGHEYLTNTRNCYSERFSFFAFFSCGRKGRYFEPKE